MLKISKYTEYLQNILDDITDGNDWKFLLHGIIGDVETHEMAVSVYKKPRYQVNCTLSEISSTVIPLASIKSYIVRHSLQVAAPTSEQTDFDDVYDTLNEFIATINGNTTVFIDDDGNAYNASISTSTISTGDEGIMPEIGRGVPLEIAITWTMVLLGVLANNVTFTLDGEDIPPYDFVISRERTGTTASFGNDKDLKTQIMQQGISFSFVLPYVNNTLCAKIMNDILKGELGTKYTLVYNDGVANGGTNITFSVVLTSGTMNAQAPACCVMSIVLTLAK